MGSYTPAQFGDVYDLGDLGGISLKGALNSVKKAVVDTGHAVGKVVTSKPAQAVLGVGLAATGVGAPEAALIFAGTKAAGTAIKPGGNVKSVLTAGAQGAAEGVVAAGVGGGVRKLLAAKNAPKKAAPDVPPAIIEKVAQVQKIDAAIPSSDTSPAANAARAQKDAIAVDVAKGGLKMRSKKGLAIAGAAANTVDRSGSDYAKKSRDTQKQADAAATRGDTSSAKSLTAEALRLASLATKAGTTARNIRGAIQTATGQVESAVGVANRTGEAIVAGTDAAVGAAATNNASLGSSFAKVMDSPFFWPAVGVGALFLFAPKRSGGR